MWLHEMVAHKGYADAELLNAVSQLAAARSHQDLQALLQHVLVANRFWLLLIVGEPFAGDVEMRTPASFEALVAGFRTTHERELAWLSAAAAPMLNEAREHPLIPGGRCLVTDALVQVCLHAQGHRAQCARMLRAVGGTPPAVDFILWRVERRAPRWPG